MGKKFAVFVFSVLFVFSTISAFSQAKTRQALADELAKIKKDYYEKKYDIDNQVREISREWHMYQLKKHQEIKANPEKERVIRAEIWKATKELYDKKKALYNKLTPLRKDWYKRRAEIWAKIAEIDAAAKAKFD